MDYVAQWFAGEFQKQKETYEASNNGHFGAYDLTFSEWQHTPDFGGYKDQPPSQWEADLFGGIAPGFAGPNFVYVGLAAIAPDLNLAYFELRDPGVLA